MITRDSKWRAQCEFRHIGVKVYGCVYGTGKSPVVGSSIVKSIMGDKFILSLSVEGAQVRLSPNLVI